MKTKFFLIAVVSVILMGCKSEEPEQNERLTGCWSEPYHVVGAGYMVKSITFNEDGTLIYKTQPDTTWNIITDEGGIKVKLNYTIPKDNELCISGEREKHSDSIFVREPFSFNTGFIIEGARLTIDSFACDAGMEYGFIKPLILYKKL